MWFSEPCLSSWCWQTRFRCVHDNRGISRVPRWELQTVTPGCTSRKQDTGTFTGFWMDDVDYVKLLLQRVWRFYQGDGTRPHLRRVWKTSSRGEVQRAAAAGGRRTAFDHRYQVKTGAAADFNSRRFLCEFTVTHVTTATHYMVGGADNTKHSHKRANHRVFPHSLPLKPEQESNRMWSLQQRQRLGLKLQVTALWCVRQQNKNGHWSHKHFNIVAD